MDQKRKRKTSKLFKNTLQHCLSFWSLLSYFITQEVVESRDKCHFVHWNRIHYFLVTETIFLLVLCVLCVSPSRLWDNCNILQVLALIKDLTWIFDTQFCMYGNQDFIVGKPFFNSCWYFNYPGLWSFCLTICFLGLQSEVPTCLYCVSLWTTMYIVMTHCSGGEGAFVRVSQTLTLDIHTADVCKDELATGPCFYPWFTSGANMLAPTSLLLLLWPGKGQPSEEGWRYSQHGREGTAEGAACSCGSRSLKSLAHISED